MLLNSNSSLCKPAAVTDSVIYLTVVSDLSHNEAVEGHLIDVTVDSGFVTLTGKVDNLLGKDRAERLCYTIRGVRGIINRIEVIPVKRSVSELRGDISRALILDPVTESLDLTCNISHDTVFLGGTVQSIVQKQLADETVKGIKGVSHIENNITVVPVSIRSEREIKKEIKGLLKSDPFIYDKMIKVAVHKGVVRLSGTVGSIAEKLYARINAYVPGAVAVIDSGITVKLWAKDPLRRKGKLVIKPDEAIVEEMGALFKRDPRISPSDIRIAMKKGNVMLKGTVENLNTKRQAEETALNLIGVYHVENNIKVRPEEYLGDGEMEKRIAEKVRLDPIVDRHELKIIVRNGKAHVYGAVDSRYEKNHVTEIIAKIPGVITVANYASVRNDDLPWTPENDSIIRANITDEYLSQFIVDLSDLSISVKDGIATVTGDIESMKELRAIVENAFDGGAKMVVTRLMFNGMKKYGVYDYRGNYTFN